MKEGLTISEMYKITEWDDTEYVVSVEFLLCGDVLVTYLDGVCHKVSSKYFWYELRAQPAPTETN